MEYRLLGKSGTGVSELCLGTMTFGNTTSEQDSIEIIRRFIDRGGNFLDTANVYVDGRSEEIVGKAIRDCRSDIVLATKVRMKVGEGINGAGLSRKHIMQAVDDSLRRLNTDYIDLYQVHTWDAHTPLEETLRALDALVTAGKVRYIGCSNYLSWQIMKALCISDFRGWAKFVSLQPQYSLVSREMDREVMPLCIEEDLAVLPWGPLGSGFLTGKYNKGSKPTVGRLSYAQGEASWENRNQERNFAVLEEVQKIAKDRGKTPAQVSLNWLLGKKGVTSPIFGANSLEQFEENMGAVGWKLTDEEWKRLDEVSSLPEEYPARFIAKFRRDF